MSADPDGASPETELKFAVEPDAMAALRSHPRFEDGKAPQKLTSIYFDTPSHLLRQNGYSLRVRSDGRRWLQTIKRKQSATPFVRDEWEVEVEGDRPNLEAAGQTPLASLLPEANGQLAPIVTTEVERTLRLHRQQDALVEISLDEGELISGKEREPIREVELELKEGEPHALFDLARILSDGAPLRLCLESKSDRGYRLAGDDGLAGLKAEQAVVPPEARTADAFRIVVRSCLRHIANAAAFARSHRVEGIHQTRIGVRRLRAAILLFRDLVDPDEAQPLRRELKWLAGELTDARDLDVFVAATFGRAGEETEGDAAMVAFRRRVLTAQSKAQKRALEALESPRFARLLLEVAAWSETGRLEPKLADQPAPDFAAQVLKDLRKAVRKRGGALVEDAEERHELRIEVKKLRYAAEFFAQTFGPAAKQRRRFVQRLRKLQDVLGELNDIEVARGLAARLIEGRSPELAFAAGEAIGRRQGGERKLLQKASTAFGKFADVKPFWRVVRSFSSSRPTAPSAEPAG